MSSEGLLQKIKEKADWHCKHCMQVFDSYEEAQKHETIDEKDPHHISGEIDVIKALVLVGEWQKQLQKHIDKFPRFYISKMDTVEIQLQTLNIALADFEKWFEGLRRHLK